MAHTVDLVVVAIGTALAVGAFFFARGNGGGAALEQLERANRILSARIDELEASDATKSRRIAELEGKTDLTVALVPVLNQLERHDTQAEKRSNDTLNILRMIAGQLGAEQAA